jgi:hypothetical protein
MRSVPAAEFSAGWKVPSPLPRSTLTLLSLVLLV